MGNGDFGNQVWKIWFWDEKIPPLHATGEVGRCFEGMDQGRNLAWQNNRNAISRSKLSISFCSPHFYDFLNQFINTC